MDSPPVPVVFEPLFQPRPWGGRRLASHFGKALPPEIAIGESWELSGLPGHVSRVRGGPLAGLTLTELVGRWGERLLGRAALRAGRFPLLIKFLDAREPLSVQVHPPAPHVDAKDEAWFIVAADAGAELLIGLREGVSRADLAAAAGRAATVDLLRCWPAVPGCCYLLPSGTPHALGGGVLVAEVQTPSDVTYRLYDWERRDAAGRPRALHIAEGLACVREDVAPEVIAPASARADASGLLVSCPYFSIARRRCDVGFTAVAEAAEMLIWIVLSGRGLVRTTAAVLPFALGDVILIPAEHAGLGIEAVESAEFLEARAVP